MPIDPYIARGVAPVDVTNTLAQVYALKQRDQGLALDQRQFAESQNQNAFLRQKYDAATAKETKLDEIWHSGLEDINSTDPATVQQGYLKLAQVHPEAVSAIAKLKGHKGVGDDGFGNVNPGDFAPASIDKYRQSGNYADLQRIFAPPQPVMLQSPAFGAALVNRGTGGVIQQYTTPEQEAAAKANQAGAAATAETTSKATAERQAGIAKKINDAQNVSDVLDMAVPLVHAATGSLSGALYDKAANVLGESPSGDQAIGALKTLEAKIVLAMPRMEGPQSDRDAMLYREAAGQLGDPTVPRAKKLAAIRTIRETNARYEARNKAGVPSSSDRPPANLLKEGVETTFKNGQVWTVRGGKAVRVK